MATLFRPRDRASFYHRAIIPRHLRRYFQGREQIWRSLSTNDRDDATLKTQAWKTKAQRLFLVLKRGGALMTPAEIERLIAQWMNSELEKTEDYRAEHRLDEGHREILSDLAIERLEVTEDVLAYNRYDRVAEEVETMLKAGGLPLPPHGSLAFKRCCRAFLLAKEEMLGTELERWSNNYQPRLSRAVSAVPPVPQKKQSPLFSVVVKKYLVENKRAKRTADQVRIEIDKFQKAIGGDRPVASITKDEARCIKNPCSTIVKWPSPRLPSTCTHSRACLHGRRNRASSRKVQRIPRRTLPPRKASKRRGTRHSTIHQPGIAAGVLVAHLHATTGRTS